MQRSRFLQFLSIPAALGLGTALVIACGDGSPTSPDQSQVRAEFKKGGKKTGGRDPIVDDVDGACKQNYTLTAAPALSGLEGYDLNNNQWVCVLTP